MSSFQVVKPEIAPSLLLPCVDPVLAPENPRDNEVAAARIRVAKAYVDCRDRHAALTIGSGCPGPHLGRADTAAGASS